MTNLDYAVLLFYLLGTLAISFVVSARNKSADDMFAAGGQSPWWAAGLSSFMTMFSAGTFVVWGGIAYKYGVVAIAINLCYGVAAILVGYTLAGRWNSLGIRTPAEFIDLRFGRPALHFYMAFMMAFKVFGTAVSIYALSVMMTDMMPLAEGNPLRDPHTGNLSLLAAIIGLGGLIVLYTVVGGLWGVLMTDVLQFIVLNVAVLIVVPLAISRAGGVRAIVDAAPQGFFLPTGGGYTWWFLAGWVMIHYFVVGAEWAYIQRYLCVSSPHAAKKGAYLFGLLYFASPFVWFAPPLAYRAIEPFPAEGLTPALLAQLSPQDLANVPSSAIEAVRAGDLAQLSSQEISRLRGAAINNIGEHAYARVCSEVLPIGMTGMMLAAMFSATASGASGYLNVFAGVLTNDFYMPLLRSRNARVDNSHFIRVGRIFTVVLGTIMVCLALAVPRLGGAERVIVSITSFMTVPLLAPVLWGLMSRRIGNAAVWATAAISTCAMVLVKVLLTPGGLLAESTSLQSLIGWIAANELTTEIAFGVGLPLATLIGVHLLSRGTSDGSRRVSMLAPLHRPLPDQEVNREMATIVGWSLVTCAVVIASFLLVNDKDWGILSGSAAMLGLLAATVFRMAGSTRSVTGEPSHVEA